MLVKERKTPRRLLVMNSLAKRMDLSRDDRNRHRNWVKGEEGEVKFCGLTRVRLTRDCLILNDLYLEVKGKSCQLDALVITAEGISIFEVKNFEGEYYYQNEKMYYGRTEKEVYDPAYQIRNAESVVRQLLDQLGYRFAVKKYIVFINPHFTLFGAPRNSGLILPSMIDAHFTALNEKSGHLNQTHHQFAEEIKALHKEEFSLRQVPYYDNTLLKKGVTCVECGKFIKQFTKKRSCVCNHCGKEELVAHTIVRMAKECKLLFPDQKITVTVIREWCDNQLSAGRIRYVLNQYFKAVGTGRWRYYKESKSS